MLRVGTSLELALDRIRTVLRLDSAFNLPSNVSNELLRGGSRNEKKVMIQFMVSSTLYGLALEIQHLAALKKLSAQVWDVVWGPARFMTQRAWAWAAVLQVGICPISVWWLESSRLLHALAGKSEFRDEVVSIWNQGLNRSGNGLWPVSFREWTLASLL